MHSKREWQAKQASEWTNKRERNRVHLNWMRALALLECDSGIKIEEEKEIENQIESYVNWEGARIVTTSSPWWECEREYITGKWNTWSEKAEHQIEREREHTQKPIGIYSLKHTYYTRTMHACMQCCGSNETLIHNPYHTGIRGRCER